MKSPVTVPGPENKRHHFHQGQHQPELNGISVPPSWITNSAILSATLNPLGVRLLLLDDESLPMK